MIYHASHPLPIVLALLAVSTGASASATEAWVTVFLDRSPRAVIAFLPVSMRDLESSTAAAARTGARSAIDSIRRCLGESDVSYQVVFADRIVIRSKGREESFDVGYFAPLVGAILVRESFDASILYAGGGPEALPRMLRSAASAYFGRQCRAG